MFWGVITLEWLKSLNCLHKVAYETIGMLFLVESLGQEQIMKIGNFHDDDVWLQLPEFISFLLFKFVNSTEVYRTRALICTRKQQTEGFW